MEDAHYTPALGRSGFTGAYDLTIRLLTREQKWRTALLRQVAPQDGETILDVGCGTGTFAIMLKRAAPGARVIGLDPDPQILAIAADKARKAGVSMELHQGFASDSSRFVALDKAVSSLVFHQVPLAGKSAGITAMFASVRAGGEVHIADYARQAGIMRPLFRLTIQRLDGAADTQPNADGEIERLLAEQTGSAVQARAVVPTITGTISLFMAAKPGD